MRLQSACVTRCRGLCASLFHAYGVRRRGGSADAPERGSRDKRVNQILNQKSATGPEVSLVPIARQARTAG